MPPKGTKRKREKAPNAVEEPPKSSKDGRKERARTSYPHLFKMYEDLKDLAKDIQSWEWDGSSYTKSSRACRPDSNSLIAHATPLEVFARHAPTGYPSHKIIAKFFVQLHKLDKVFKNFEKNATDKDPFDVI